MGGCERLKIQNAFSVRQWSTGWHYYAQIEHVNLCLLTRTKNQRELEESDTHELNNIILV
jgi:hypothetical protein